VKEVQTCAIPITPAEEESEEKDSSDDESK
jgi:hypothetical protein